MRRKQKTMKKSVEVSMTEIKKEWGNILTGVRLKLKTSP